MNEKRDGAADRLDADGKQTQNVGPIVVTTLEDYMSRQRGRLLMVKTRSDRSLTDRAPRGRRLERLMRLNATIPAAILLALAGHAVAAPEEIQVYEDDMDKPGQFGLDVHNSYVWGRPSALQYAGEQQPDDRYRITPEWSYGLTPAVELGLYLPLATISNNAVDLSGAKVRIKYIAPKGAAQDWYWGLNFELGAVRRPLDLNPWNAELKGIVGWRRGRWDVAFNTNVDFVVSGPEPGSPSVQLATKVSYKVIEPLAIGVESYNGIGTFKRFLSPAGQGHSTFLTADTAFGAWGLNVGVGHGYSGEPDHWIFKFILTVPIDD